VIVPPRKVLDLPPVMPVKSSSLKMKRAFSLQEERKIEIQIKRTREKKTSTEIVM